jgi:polar amino acid transport system permease protein
MSLRVFGWPELEFMLMSLRWTALLSLIAFAGGGIVGLVLAGLRVAPSLMARRLVDGFITLFQGTPLLVQLLLFYYGASFLGFTPNALLAAALAFTLNSAAFFGEIWRGCLEAIPAGQWDGARALGFGFMGALRLVILPQAVRTMAAPTVGYMVQIVKGTSVASLIGITEVTRSAVMVNTVTFEPVQVFGTVCAVYFVLCWPLSLASEWMGRRWTARSGSDIGAVLRRAPR